MPRRFDCCQDATSPCFAATLYGATLLADAFDSRHAVATLISLIDDKDTPLLWLRCHYKMRRRVYSACFTPHAAYLALPPAAPLMLPLLRCTNDDRRAITLTRARRYACLIITTP